MTHAQMIERAMSKTGAPRPLVERAVVEFGRYGLGEVVQVVRFTMSEIARLF